MKKIILIGILILFSLTLISAIEVGNSGQIGVDLNIPTPINYTQVNVNNSIYWGGHPFSYLTNNYLLSSGDTATGDYTFDTSTLFIDSSTDRVGIGTTTPDSIFHIKANFPGIIGFDYAGQLIIQDPDDSVFGNAVITGYESDGDGNPDQQLWYLGSSSVSNSDIIFLNRRNSKLQLGTSGTSRMTILGNGYVGIGTESPGVPLEVAGNVKTTGTLEINHASPTLHFTDTTAAQDSYQIYVNSGNFQIYNTDDARYDFTIDGDGAVGIGTTTPSNKFHVRYDGANSYYGTGANSLVYLQVQGSRAMYGYDGVALRIQGGSKPIRMVTDNTGFGSGTVAFYIGTDNKVGIGTTTPQNLLNVDGDLNVTGLIINDAIYCESSELIDQTFATAGVRYRLNISNVDEGNGITMATGNNGTNITIDTSGVYHMVAQPQVKAGAGAAGDFHMWLEKFTIGWSDIPNSNIELKLSSLEEDVIVLATTLKLNQGEKLRLVVSVSDDGILLHAQSLAGEPVIPSIIFTMYRIGN